MSGRSVSRRTVRSAVNLALVAVWVTLGLVRGSIDPWGWVFFSVAVALGVLAVARSWWGDHHPEAERRLSAKAEAKQQGMAERIDREQRAAEAARRARERLG